MLNDDGFYDVLVSSPCNGQALGSTAVRLVVNEAPAITSQPTNQVVCLGTPVTFTVTASGSNLTYQWGKNGVPIADATKKSYTIPAVAESDAGNYDVLVTSEACASTLASTAATLTISTPFAITTQPRSVAACARDTVSFTVVASGTVTTYQWRKNGVAIAGATSATYTIASASATHVGDYTVVVTGPCSPAGTSSVATLSVGTPVQIVGHPRYQTVCAGSPVTFSVQAIGSAMAGKEFVFQWRKSGVAIAGATREIYTIKSAAAADAGNYDVTISNVCGPVASAVAVVTVPAPAACTAQPADVTAREGTTAQMSVTATGSGLTYQWRKNGKALGDGSGISGARTATLTLPVSAALVGNYDVVVKGTCGAATTSSSAKLLMNGNPKITVQPKTLTTVSPYFNVAIATNKLTVTAEDARVTFTGPTDVKATAAGRATVALKVTVKDITAVDASDTSAGNIANARVAFVNRDTQKIISEVAVVASSDSKVGTASFSFPVNLGTASSMTYTIGMVVKNFYAQDDAGMDQVITIHKP